MREAAGTSREHRTTRAFLALLVTLAAGCAAPVAPAPAPGASLERTVVPTAGGEPRSYRLYVPDRPPAGPLPVVVVLHGAFSRPEVIDRHAGWSALADEKKFVVLYPNGIGLFGGLLQHWNAGHCCGKALARNVDDVGFVMQVLDDAARQWPIDRRRVYLAGFSNGAMLVHRIAAEHGESFAAVAAVAGPPAGRSGPLDHWWRIPEPSAPLPVLLVHGRADRTVPWQGRLTGSFRMAPALYGARLWAEIDDCERPPRRSLRREGRIEMLRFEGCRRGTEVALLTLEGWGHRWPAPYHTGRLPQDDPLHGFDGTREIWRFFERFERRDAQLVAVP